MAQPGLRVVADTPRGATTADDQIRDAESDSNAHAYGTAVGLRPDDDPETSGSEERSQ